MSQEICWTEEFTGSKPNFLLRFYDSKTEEIVDVREIAVPDYASAVKWAAENSPAECDCGCLIVAL